ncbi:hypothetical protein HYH02_013294 [Chlamydomonas schloesseri]|uniref:Uncharacterized protein n=1 Tax=Chlamydomonas schloesseri TaxID=2026947 RepID=A0A835T4U6_9CHLO|nr:hypothetical protein HYH02_013294 [Chlamydomonas schloesseri]|eukprot:KAG2431601.1 hypothetical protein HYH02_013294 [Chlamydomonas schloesseri]
MSSAASCCWAELHEELVLAVARSLHENDIATSAKLLNKHYARCLRGFRVVRASQPLPGWTRRNHPTHLVARLASAFQPWPAHGFVAHWGRPEPWRCLTLPQRRRVLCLAASSGDAGSLEAALAQCGLCGCCAPDTATQSAAFSAALAGHAPVCEMLFAVDQTVVNFDVLSLAAEAGHVEVCRWLWRKWECIRPQAPPEAPDLHLCIARLACIAACRGGHEECIALLLQELERALVNSRQQQQQQAQGLAMRGGRGELLTDLPHFPFHAATAAAEGGHADLSDHWAQQQLLRDRGLPPLDAARLAEHAAAAGNTAALSWLLEQPEGQGLAASDELRRAAASAGHAPVLEALRAAGSEFDMSHATAAAESCHSAALRWMADGGVVAAGDAAAWSVVWQRAAAAGVDLATLRLLHEQRGAAVDVASAAAGGSVESVEWAVGRLEQQAAAATGVAGGSGTTGGSGAAGTSMGAASADAAASAMPLDAMWAALQAGNWATLALLLQLARPGAHVPGSAVLTELEAYVERMAPAETLPEAKRSLTEAVRWATEQLSEEGKVLKERSKARNQQSVPARL